MPPRRRRVAKPVLLYVTHSPSVQARYLKFCQDYYNLACCIPGHDLENQLQFENLIAGLGPGCKNPMMYPEIRYYYCLGCDPEQPKYTTYVNSTSNGQKVFVEDEIRVCKSFVKFLWTNPTYPDCGVMKSNPCPDSWGDNGFDPYTCGDDLILPGVEFSDGIDFINAFKPPGLDEFTFVEVDDTVPDYDETKTPCWSAEAFTKSSSASRLGTSSATSSAIMLGLVLRSML
jgi:hypothetical protein